MAELVYALVLGTSSLTGLRVRVSPEAPNYNVLMALEAIFSLIKIVILYNDVMKKEIKMLHVTDANFEKEVLQSDIPVFVDFYAEWCGPCKLMGPIFEQVASKYEGKVKFVKLNVDEARDSAMKYGVMSIPTLITFNKSEVVESSVGLQDEPSIVAKAEKLLK